ncbi:MAG TPA: hypothetical protein VGI16_00585 [Candidatus Acidoferrum sp.]|jgi:hypothetical protein
MLSGYGKRLAALCWMLLLAPVFLQLSMAQDAVKATDDIAVLVNPANPTTNLSVAELRRIMNGERRSWNGKLPVQLVTRSAGAKERSVLLSVVLQMNEREYKAYWMQKVFSGEFSSPPLEVPSNGSQCEFVTGSQGGLALVAGHDVRLSLKVLRIDGKFPGEPGYPLK